MRPLLILSLLVCCLISFAACSQSTTISGKSYSTLSAITPANDVFFFTLNDDEHGLELWKSDGTTNGTNLVKDINPNQSSSSPQNFTLLDNILYFTADDGTHGNELWRSDGTTRGTWMVADIAHGMSSSVIKEIKAFDERLFISVEIEGEGMVWLQSDGMSCETVAVGESMLPKINRSVNEELASDSPLLLRDKDYFAASTRQKGEELWCSTGNRTKLVKDIRAGREASNIIGLVVVDEKAYFSAHDGIHGSELWTSDGTPEGTKMIMDILPGLASSLPRNLTAFNGQIYFSIFAETGIQLWVTDGSVNGTHQVFPAVEMEAVSFPVFLKPDSSPSNEVLKAFACDGFEVRGYLLQTNKDDCARMQPQSVRIRVRNNIEMVQVSKLD